MPPRPSAINSVQKACRILRSLTEPRVSRLSEVASQAALNKVTTLRILEVQGLIRIKTGRAGGAFVQKPDDESVADSVALVIRGRRIRLGARIVRRRA